MEWLFHLARQTAWCLGPALHGFIQRGPQLRTASATTPLSPPMIQTARGLSITSVLLAGDWLQQVGIWALLLALVQPPHYLQVETTSYQPQRLRSCEIHQKQQGQAN